VRWSWQPGIADAHPEAPYTFTYRIPGVGDSASVEVWVVPPHDPPRFNVCASVTRPGPCFNDGMDVVPGEAVHLRGRITPAHPGTGRVLRLGPEDRGWTVVANVAIARDGTARWSWFPRLRDVRLKSPYRFRFLAPGLARSNGIEIWVQPPHGR
jgi:hypothetical protein